jgi:hypothetical protein
MYLQQDNIHVTPYSMGSVVHSVPSSAGLCGGSLHLFNPMKSDINLQYVQIQIL